MTPDAASAPPGKRSWKRLMVALACVVAVTIIALLATTPKKEPVGVWFTHSTNFMDAKALVFKGTNGTTKEIRVVAHVVSGAIHPAKETTGLPPAEGLAIFFVEAGTNFTFTLEAPPRDVPYWVVWQCFDEAPNQTRWERFRAGCYNFLYTHGMPRLAGRFNSPPDMHYIPSSEIKE